MNIPIDTYLHICDYLDDDQVLDLYKQNAVPKDYIIGYRHIPLFAFIKNDIKVDLDLFDLDAYDVNDAVCYNNSYYFYKLLELTKDDFDDVDIHHVLDYAIYDKQNYDFARYALQYWNLDIYRQYHYHLIMKDYDYILSIMDVFDFNVPNEYFNAIYETIQNGSIPVIDKMLNSLHQEIDYIDTEVLRGIYYDHSDIAKLRFLLDHSKINFMTFFGNEMLIYNDEEIWLHIINSPRCQLEEALSFGVSYDQYDLIERRKHEIQNPNQRQMLFTTCFELENFDMMKFLLDRFEFNYEIGTYSLDFLKSVLTDEMVSYLVNHKNYDKEKNIEFTNLLQQNFNITT